MTMHLVGPYLTLTGKKKGKKKFASAEHKHRAEQLDQEWRELQKKWGVEAKGKKRGQAMSSEVWVSEPNRRLAENKIPSLNTGWVPCTKKAAPVYTGDKIIGIAVQHKSCLQPVFNSDHIVEIARMRR